jgi:hypothetical protein
MVDDALRSFRFDSQYWKVAPPAKDSVLVFTTKRTPDQFERYPHSTPQRYQSSSIGSAYSLTWTSIKESTRSEALLRIIRTKPRRLSVGRSA